MPQDPAPTSMTQLARECDERIAAMHAKYDKHEATLDRLNQGIDRVLAGHEPKADAQLEAAVFGLGPSAGFDAASRCMEDEEPFDDATGPMVAMAPNLIGKRVAHRGCGYPDDNRYEATSHTPPTKAEVTQWQTDLGFHPNGYFPPSNIRTEERDGAFVTTWTSAASCD